MATPKRKPAARHHEPDHDHCCPAKVDAAIRLLTGGARTPSADVVAAAERVVVEFLAPPPPPAETPAAP